MRYINNRAHFTLPRFSGSSRFPRATVIRDTDSQSKTRVKSPQASGKTAYFSFQYGLDPKEVGNIRTSAEASYTVRISSGGMYPTVIDRYFHPDI
ncbi:hypothetical protein J23TS9_42350 [Paenibacillus sp. J23TS9]|nr:hypothetical protein J23TS9_42350 [Paenibacillus sp. J23TS9]